MRVTRTPASAKGQQRTKAAKSGTQPAKPASRQDSLGAALDRRTWIDTGVRFSEDPDAAKRTVWVFKTGTTFHRRDCQVVESRGGATEIPVEKAHKRNLVRCMHCAPTVR